MSNDEVNPYAPPRVARASAIPSRWSRTTAHILMSAFILIVGSVTSSSILLAVSALYYFGTLAYVSKTLFD